MNLAPSQFRPDDSVTYLHGSVIAEVFVERKFHLFVVSETAPTLESSSGSGMVFSRAVRFAGLRTMILMTFSLASSVLGKVAEVHWISAAGAFLLAFGMISLLDWVRRADVERRAKMD